MTNIELTVPGVEQTINPTTITSARELEQWAEHLPYADMPSVARQVYRSLYLLTRHPKPVGNRISLMNCYLPPLKNMLASLRCMQPSQVGHADHSTEAAYRKLFENVVVEMTHGFKKVVNESSNGLRLKNNQQVQAQALFYAMHGLVLQLMLAFSGYTQEPRQAWSEIIQLFKIAEGLGVGELPVTNQLLEKQPTTDIRSEFKRIVLLILLDPFRLERGEVWHAYDYLARWSNLVHVSPVPDPLPQKEGKFLVDLQGLKRPFAYSSDRPSGQYLLVNCLPLNIEINNQVKGLKEKSAQPIRGAEKILPGQAGEMLRHMLLAWHICPARRHEREERYDWLFSCCGLHSVNHYLRRGGLRERQHTSADASDEEEFLITAHHQQDQLSFPKHRWRQTNVSVSGVGVVIPENDRGQIQVGQLIMLESELAHQNSRQMIGVVRRLIRRDSDSLEAGIQFIQGRLLPAQVRPVSFGSQEHADFQSALLLERGEQHPPVLFTPQMLFQPKREYIIETSYGETQKVYSENLLEATRCFERFEYRVISLHG